MGSNRLDGFLDEFPKSNSAIFTSNLTYLNEFAEPGGYVGLSENVGYIPNEIAI